MGHCYSVVGTIVYDDGGRVVICDVPDFLPVRAVPRGHKRHPGGALHLRGSREPDTGVARLSVLLKGREQHRSPGFSLGRVLAVATALRLLCFNLHGNRVQIGDVDESRVPLLLLRDREVQAEQVHEAERQQPRRKSQTAAGSDEGRSHGATGGRSEGAWCQPLSPPLPPSHTVIGPETQLKSRAS